LSPETQPGGDLFGARGALKMLGPPNAAERRESKRLAYGREAARGGNRRNCEKVQKRRA